MLKIAFNSNYIYPLEENHRFPMIKYELIPEQLIRENTCVDENFFSPGKIDSKIVLKTHQKEYFKRFTSLQLSKKEIREIGFPLSQELVDRELQIAQGTVSGVNYSLKNGISMNIAGGTASLFNSNPNVYTLSFHGKKNYPFRKEKSDLDVEFDDNTNDNKYLKVLKETIPKVIDQFEPEFIFYLSGVDVLQNDKLGRLSLTLNGCKERDKFILQTCKDNSIPLQVSMGGGYSIVLKNIIEAHSNTFRLAQEIFF